MMTDRPSTPVPVGGNELLCPPYEEDDATRNGESLPGINNGTAAPASRDFEYTSSFADIQARIARFIEGDFTDVTAASTGVFTPEDPVLSTAAVTRAQEVEESKESEEEEKEKQD